MPKKYKTPKKKSGFLGALIVFVFAVVLAFSVALRIYISMQPPIKNLKDFKPGVVTKIYSANEKEVIKTFTAYNYERKDIKCNTY